MIKTMLIVGLGSFCGGISRYLVARICDYGNGQLIPWGTLAANLAGCFILGVVCSLLERGYMVSPHLKMFLTIGFCGSFTTFSTFMNENFQMVSNRNFLLMAGYLFISLLGGFLMLWMGRAVVKMF